MEKKTSNRERNQTMTRVKGIEWLKEKGAIYRKERPQHWYILDKFGKEWHLARSWEAACNNLKILLKRRSSYFNF